MTIRNLESHEIEELVRLWTECDLTRPWNDPQLDISRALENPTSTILVSVLDSKIIASVMVGTDGHRGWIYYLGVLSEHRRRGFGSQMVTAAEDWLKMRQVAKLMLMVRKSNSSATNFYRSIGYFESDVITLERWLTSDGKRPS